MTDLSFLENMESPFKKIISTSSKKVNQFPSNQSNTENFEQVPKGYDPTFYENLDVGHEAKEVLQYIMK